LIRTEIDRQLLPFYHLPAISEAAH